MTTPTDRKNDSLALVDLYNNTDGPNWRQNTNWLSAPVSTWYGITVSGGRVTEIGLSFNDMAGNLPASIGNLLNLTFLVLNGNQLSSLIPATIGNLTRLTILDLTVNNFTGIIPSSIGNLTNLTQLQLGNNQLTGSIPSVIGNLTQLIIY